MISQLVTLLIILPCIWKSQYCVCSRKVYKGDNEFGVTKFKVTAADQHKYVLRPVFCFVFFGGGLLLQLLLLQRTMMGLLPPPNPRYYCPLEVFSLANLHRYLLCFPSCTLTWCGATRNRTAIPVTSRDSRHVTPSHACILIII